MEKTEDVQIWENQEFWKLYLDILSVWNTDVK